VRERAKLLTPNGNAFSNRLELFKAFCKINQCQSRQSCQSSTKKIRKSGSK
jgi:hypothetical protein